ncbi:ribosome maturation factor RimP [Oligoflexia bacterium]|nr:ribosome maturation factor RimP [Oligoflexia bacterium]
MITKSELWDRIKPVIEEAGFDLFDVDLPSGQSGVLRVFISQKLNSDNAITLDHCANISRSLSALDGFEESLPERTTLEVSSPGVNRRLRSVEHFQGAVGEHIKVKVCDASNKKSVVKGTLKSFDGSVLHIGDDDLSKDVSVLLSDISEARVDYIFQ